jgi:hypothetical protein
MSIRFVYTPRFVGAALNATAQTLSMVKHAATRRLNAIVTATRAQKTLTERTAAGSFGSSFDFYISTTGTGTASGGGTISDPWPISMLINATAQARYAGKRVGLMDGTYNIPVDNTVFEAPYWNVAGGTDDSNRTIIEAVNPRAATLTGNVAGGGTRCEQAIIGTTEEWVTFKNLVITYGEFKLLQILASNVTVDGCEIHNLLSAGDNTDLIRLEGGTGAGARIDGILITNCKLRNVTHGGTVAGSTANAAAVKIYNAENVIVEYCSFDTMHAAVFEKSNSAATTIRYCFAHTLRCFANTVGSKYANGTWQGTPSNYTCYIHHNIVVGAEKFHDEEMGDNLHGQHVQEYNNTYYGSYSGGTYIQAYRGTDADLWDSKNNIWHLTSSSGGGLVYNSTTAINTMDYNAYPGTLRWLSGTYTTLGTWSAATGFDTHSVTTSAGFANAGGTTPEDYVTSGLQTQGDDGGPLGAWDTGVTQIGVNW